MAEEEIEYVSYKKVIIFGVEGSGKSTLSKSLETGKFSEQTPTKDSKIYFKLLITSYFLIYFSRCQYSSTFRSSKVKRFIY